MKKTQAPEDDGHSSRPPGRNQAELVRNKLQAQERSSIKNGVFLYGGTDHRGPYSVELEYAPGRVVYTRRHHWGIHSRPDEVMEIDLPAARLLLAGRRAELLKELTTLAPSNVLDKPYEKLRPPVGRISDKLWVIDFVEMILEGPGNSKGL